MRRACVMFWQARRKLSCAESDSRAFSLKLVAARRIQVRSEPSTHTTSNSLGTSSKKARGEAIARRT